MIWEIAIPPNAPQIPRCGWSRHRSPHRPRSHLSRLSPRQILLLHLPDPILCCTAHDRLSTPAHQDPHHQHLLPTNIRHPPASPHHSKQPHLSHPVIFPRRFSASVCRPFHRRALCVFGPPSTRHNDEKLPLLLLLRPHP